MIEASVESTLLFDCQARTWRVSEIKRMQKLVDKAYRYVWNRRNKLPLMQMQEEARNMEDVRVDLGVKSLRWKIEKRCLERIGHLSKMEDDESFGVWMNERARMVAEGSREANEDYALLEEVVA